MTPLHIFLVICIIVLCAATFCVQKVQNVCDKKEQIRIQIWIMFEADGATGRLHLVE